MKELFTAKHNRRYLEYMYYEKYLAEVEIIEGVNKHPKFESFDEYMNAKLKQI